MSPVQTLFGASTAKLRANRFGATGRSCALFVASLNRRLPRARRPQACIILRTRSLPEAAEQCFLHHRALAHHQLPPAVDGQLRSAEHTSELQSLMRISYSVLC